MPDDSRLPASQDPAGDLPRENHSEPRPSDSAGTLFAPVDRPDEPSEPEPTSEPTPEQQESSNPAEPNPDEANPAAADDAAFLDVRCSLAPEKLRADYTVHSIQTGVLACVGLVVGVIRLFTAPDFLVLGFQAGVVLVAILTYKLGTDAFARASYRRSSYRVSADGLEIRRGVIWRTVITIPSSRVQHTDVSRGPLERMFGIATLAIHTAGTSNATVHLAGLPSARALRIRDYLLEARDAFDAV